MSTDDLSSLSELVQAHKERLHELLVKAARYGIDTPAQVTTEIKDIKRKLEEITKGIVSIEQDVHQRTIGSQVEKEETITRVKRDIALASDLQALVISSINSGKSITPSGPKTSRAIYITLFVAVLALATGMFVAPYVRSVSNGVISSPTAVVDNTVFPIETASVSAYPYEGVRDPQVGKGYGYLVVKSSQINGNTIIKYELNYDLPDQDDGYSGFALEFPQPQDITDYKYVELTIMFGDRESRCKIFLKDSLKKADSVILGDGKIVSAEQEEQTIKISLRDNFAHTTQKSIKEIDFSAETGFTKGKHSFTVSRILFRR